MSKLHQLIQELCPDGVEYRRLGEIGKFYGGLTGKSRSDFQGGNRRFISYINIFSNLSVDINEVNLVHINSNEIQNTIEHGDILFTGSSETPHQCGISSVMTIKPEEIIYLNSFCFGFRLFDKRLLIPDFSKHLFRSRDLRKAITKTANGVTRFNVSKKKMERVTIPLPPLPVQQEIARILDTYTELETELEEKLDRELELRKKQYEYYRDSLLRFSDDVEWPTLGNVCTSVSSGGTPLKSHAEYYHGDIPWLRTQEIKFNQINKTENTISQLGLEKSSAKWIPSNCVIVAISGATAGRCAINKIPLTTNQHCCNMEVNDAIALYKYVFYWVRNNYEQIKELGHGARNDLNVGIISSFPIPLPPLEEQKRIVEILDRFSTLTSDISVGLPAEIAARRKQYEYYRDKLLTFREKDA